MSASHSRWRAPPSRLDLAVIAQPDADRMLAWLEPAASLSNSRAPRATAALRSACASCIGSASAAPGGRAGTLCRSDRAEGRSRSRPAGRRAHGADTLPAIPLSCQRQDRANSCRVSQVSPITPQRLQTGHRVEAEVSARRARAVGLPARSRPVRSPIAASRCLPRCCCGRMLAIDDHDIQPLPCQPFGDQRAGNAGANDQRIAFGVCAIRGEADAGPLQTI